MCGIIGKLCKRLDIIGGIVGCLVGAIGAYIAYTTGKSATLEIITVILIASIIYLLFRKKLSNSINPSLPSSKLFISILNIIFISSFMASIFLMHFSLHRPLLYFLLTSISMGAIAAEILTFNNTQNQTWLILLKILLISFSLRYGLLYEFPGLYGVDPWGHIRVVREWLNSGHIINQSSSYGYISYATFPIMHLNIIATKIITLLNLKDSLFYSIGLFYIFSILFVFLLGQRLVNTKAGLLAALIIGFNSFHIGWGAWLIPTSLGIGIFAMILWLIFKGTYTFCNQLILIILMSVLVLTHTFSTFVTLTVLVLLFIANKIYKRIPETKVKPINIRYNLVILFGIIMFTRWIYYFYYPSRSFFDAVFGWFIRDLGTKVQYTGTAFKASEFILNRMGFLMLISFTVIGSLFWFSPKVSNNQKISIIISTAGLSVVTFVFPYFNIKNLIPGRWLAFICTIGAIIIAEGILALSRLVNGKIKKSLLAISIVFIFSLFMINSNGVNIYTPFYGKDYHQDPVRYAFTQSELTAVNSISEMYDDKIITDHWYSSLPFLTQVGQTKIAYLNPKSKNEGLIVIRKYIYKHEFSYEYQGRIYNEKLTEDYFVKFSSSMYNGIYSNGEVRAYLKRRAI